MNLIRSANSALVSTPRRLARDWRRPSLGLSLLDTALRMPRREEPREEPKRSKLLSLELELGGMAIEFKAKSLVGLLTWLSVDVALVAIVQELMRPRQFRTWHGR